MSWQAMSWAAGLPLSRVNGGARAVLMLLAEKADSDGRGAYPTVETLARTLDVSPRSVKRYLAELRDCGLIVAGEQACVAHILPHRRPNVWDLPNLSTGETPAVTPRGVKGVTDTGQWGDRSGSNGVTAAV